MSLITATALNTILDNACGYYLEILGTIGSTYGYGNGVGSWGASTKATNIGTAVLATGDLTLVQALASSATALSKNATAAIRAGADLSGVLFAIQSNILAYSPGANVRSLDTYLTYLNTGVPGSYWSGLQHPAWYYLGASWFNGQTPSPWNVYADAPGTGNGAAYTNYLRQLVVSGSVQTAGISIDSTKYAGGVPALVCTGITGSGVVTVTGTGRDPTNYGVATGSVTWTATVTGNGTFALAPGGGSAAPANSLILTVTNVAAAGGISAGTIQVVSQLPGGRLTEP